MIQMNKQLLNQRILINIRYLWIEIKIIKLILMNLKIEKHYKVIIFKEITEIFKEDQF